MREISCKQITDTTARLFQEANYFLGDDVIAALNRGREIEESQVSREILDKILENAEIAARERVPLCQDCGVAVIFLELGQDAHIVGGDLNEALNEGVRKGYTDGYLRKSMVRQPYSARVNTRDNTPALVHIDIVPGDKLRIIALPKGGGCENMSRLGMLVPAQGKQGVVDFVVNAIEQAGSNPCPPVIVGVGVGGGAEKAMAIAKHALTREVGKPSEDPELAELERELLERINATGVGPQGYGGRITALAVQVESFPCHIASMPVAVCVQCHSSRVKEAVL